MKPLANNEVFWALAFLTAGFLFPCIAIAEEVLVFPEATNGQWTVKTPVSHFKRSFFIRSSEKAEIKGLTAQVF
jgi:hypothetical protein